MKIKSFLIVLLIFCLLFFFISNISAVNTIDDYAYVMAIGIDSLDNNRINLSLQIAIASSDGSDSSSSQSLSSIVNTIDCNTIDCGINQINNTLNKKLNLSYCKAIVFSKDKAKLGIGNEVSDLINDLELRPSCNLIVCDNTAKEYLENSNPLLEKLSSKYYENEKFSEKNTSFTKATTLIDFYNNMFSSKTQPYAILSRISNKKDNQDNKKNKNTKNADSMENTASDSSDSSDSNDNNDKSDGNKSNSEESIKKQKETPHINSYGIAVFNNDMYVGDLSSQESIIHLILLNEFKHTIVSIPSPFESNKYISLDISKANATNHVDFFNNTTFISCNLKLKAKLLSNSKDINYMDKENIKKIEESCNNYFSDLTNSYFNKTSKNFNSDITHFGEIASRKFMTNDDWNKINWLNNYKNCIFNINVNTNIESSFIVLN